MSGIIEVTNLHKRYGETEAVKGICFSVENGMLFAFLGPNGAGKSTTIDILCTLLQNDGGTVTINGYTLGKDDDKIRAQIGVVFQENMLDDMLTVKENLYIRGRFYHLSGKELESAVQKAAAAAGALTFLNQRYGRLSGGQKRRADIARALIHTPKILFLDEPTTGLDPQTRQSIWETVRMLQSEQHMTVFLTTHYMEEAAAADYVMIIDNGQTAAFGTPDELRRQYASDTLSMQTDRAEQLTQLLEQLGISYRFTGHTFKVTLKRTTDAIAILEACKSLVTNVEVSNGTLDEAFIHITGKEIRA